MAEAGSGFKQGASRKAKELNDKDSANVTIFGKYNNLFDVAKEDVPGLAGVSAKSKLESTKGVTHHEIDVNTKLEKLVFCPDLFENISARAKQLTENMAINPNILRHKIFVAKVIPTFYQSLLPGMVCSETDVLDYIKHAMIEPALAISRAVIYWKIGFHNDEDRKYPFFASVPHVGIIPDGGCVLRSSKASEEHNPPLGFCLEAKAPPVYNHSDIRGLAKFTMKTKGKRVTGHAFKYHPMRFKWPKSENNVNNRDHLTAILIQIWAGLVARCTGLDDNGSGLAMLSSGKETLFFFRHGTNLYISKPYERTDAPILMIVGMFLIAAGLFKVSDVFELGKLEKDMETYVKVAWRKHVTQTGVGIDSQ